jgi:ATP-binding cassette subfamily C protein
MGIYYALQQLGMSFAEVMVLVILLARALGQMGKIQKQYQKLVTTESAFWSIRHAIEHAVQAREVSAGTAQPKLESGISFENVSFAYGDKPVLRNLSMRIPVSP